MVTQSPRIRRRSFDRRKVTLIACAMSLLLAALAAWQFRAQISPPHRSSAWLNRLQLSVQPRDPATDNHEQLRLITRNPTGTVFQADIQIDDGTHIIVGNIAGSQTVEATHEAWDGNILHATFTPEGLVSRAELDSAAGIKLLSQEPETELQSKQTAYATDGVSPAYTSTVDGIRKTVQVFRDGVLSAELCFAGELRTCLRLYGADKTLLYEETLQSETSGPGSGRSHPYEGIFFGASHTPTHRIALRVFHPAHGTSLTAETGDDLSISSIASVDPLTPLGTSLGVFADKDEFLARRAQVWSSTPDLQRLFTSFNEKLASVKALLLNTSDIGLTSEVRLVPVGAEPYVAQRILLRDHSRRIRRIDVSYRDRSQAVIWRGTDGNTTRMQRVLENGTIYEGTAAQGSLASARAINAGGYRIMEESNSGKDKRHLDFYASDGVTLLLSTDSTLEHDDQKLMYPDGRTVAAEIEMSKGIRKALRLYDSSGRLEYEETSGLTDDGFHTCVGKIVDPEGKARYRITLKSRDTIATGWNLALVEKFGADGVTVVDSIDPEHYPYSSKPLWSEKDGTKLDPANLSDRIRQQVETITAIMQPSKQMELNLLSLMFDTTR